MALPKLDIQMYKITSFSTIYLGNNLLYVNFIVLEDRGLNVMLKTKIRLRTKATIVGEIWPPSEVHWPILLPFSKKKIK